MMREASTGPIPSSVSNSFAVARLIGIGPRRTVAALTFPLLLVKEVALG